MEANQIFTCVNGTVQFNTIKGITDYTIVVVGGGGGGYGLSPGGSGGVVKATYSIPTSLQLNINVGGQGPWAFDELAYGGGGGLSQVWTNDYSMTDGSGQTVNIIAGGGGGGSHYSYGGNSGNTSGSNAGNMGNGSSNPGQGGNTNGSGGAGGSGKGDGGPGGTYGTFLFNGNTTGGSPAYHSDYGYAGGGGGAASYNGNTGNGGTTPGVVGGYNGGGSRGKGEALGTGGGGGGAGYGGGGGGELYSGGTNDGNAGGGGSSIALGTGLLQTSLIYSTGPYNYNNQQYGAGNQEGCVVISYNYANLTDDTFTQAIADWFTADATANPAPVGGTKAAPVDVQESPVYLTYGPIASWYVSGVNDMSSAFSTINNPNAALFNQDISKWNTEAATDMSYMFNGAAAFNQDISSWNTSNVGNMNSMFLGASTFDNLGIDLVNASSLWNVENVKDMSFMFYNANNFNRDISSWKNLLSVTNIANMFNGASSFDQDISAWQFYNPTVSGDRIEISNMFTNSGIQKYYNIDTKINDAIYSKWIQPQPAGVPGGYFTQDELVSAGLTPTKPSQLLTQQKKPIEINISFNFNCNISL